MTSMMTSSNNEKAAITNKTDTYDNAQRPRPLSPLPAVAQLGASYCSTMMAEQVGMGLNTLEEQARECQRNKRGEQRRLDELTKSTEAGV